MKRIYFIAVVIVLCLPMFSQADSIQRESNKNKQKEMRTIFSPNSGSGGYGAISIAYSQIGARDAILVGGRGEWIIGHGLGLGLGGYGFINDPLFDVSDNQYYNLSGGYGGFFIEPIIMGRWPVHITTPVLFGAGAIARTSFDEILITQNDPYNAYLEEASIFLVVEPGVELEFNLLRWMRLSVFGNYRFTTKLNMIDVSPSALLGWNAGITMKVGFF